MDEESGRTSWSMSEVTRQLAIYHQERVARQREKDQFTLTQTHAEDSKKSIAKLQAELDSSKEEVKTLRDSNTKLTEDLRQSELSARDKVDWSWHDDQIKEQTRQYKETITNAKEKLRKQHSNEEEKMKEKHRDKKVRYSTK